MKDPVDEAKQVGNIYDVNFEADNWQKTQQQKFLIIAWNKWKWVAAYKKR